LAITSASPPEPVPIFWGGSPSGYASAGRSPALPASVSPDLRRKVLVVLAANPFFVLNCGNAEPSVFPPNHEIRGKGGRGQHHRRGLGFLGGEKSPRNPIRVTWWVVVWPPRKSFSLLWWLMSASRVHKVLNF